MSDEERQPDEAGQQPAREEGSTYTGRISDPFGRVNSRPCT